MTTWIALFRGINVGGNNRLPMAELKSELESLELTSVRTYIQSGNVIFEAGRKSKQKLTEAIESLVEEHHGFRPRVVLLTRAELQAAVDNNPFPEASSDHKSLHFFFLTSKAAKPDLEALEKLRIPSERFELVDTLFYLHAPDGIGRSKLAAQVDKHLGVATTARNWRTVETLLTL